jgi:hypothetical protein
MCAYLRRFGAPLLKLAEGERLPSLQQLEAALLGEEQPAPAPPAEPLSPTAAGRAAAAEVQGGETVAPAPDSAVRLMMVLVDFLVGGLFSETAKAILGECWLDDCAHVPSAVLCRAALCCAECALRCV